MRPFMLIIAAVAALSGAGTASASLSETGFVVFKESRLMSITEVRAAGTGQIVSSAPSVKTRATSGDECADRSFAFSGPRWRTAPTYVVNHKSTPREIGEKATLADLLAAHEAWETPWATSCTAPKAPSAFTALYGGTTRTLASLAADLTTDGQNTVAFQSLAGTVCDGATACVVISYDKKTILEADMAFERDLTRYGYADYWTTDDHTWWDDRGGRWSVSDVAAHEFGHFAGLGHVDHSPSLTMFPFVHDGAQTLGLGDMLGVAALY